MNWTKLLIAGVVGAAVAFILGWLSWGYLFMDFFQSNAGTATGVDRGEDMLWIPMIVGHLAWGFLLAYIFEKWAQIGTFMTGLKAGATIGFMTAFAFDFISYGSTNLTNLTGVIVDIALMTVITAIVGGVVGMLLGKGN